MANSRPKIGLALSGGSGRSIAHIGVLEVLREQNIPIDYLTACSSGALIAGSYASGTMDRLKQDWLTLDKSFLLNLFELETSGRAVFSTDKAVEWGRRYLGYKKMEELRPSLGIVCADIASGEPVTLSLGDLTRAVKASCTVPGLFEPVEWGNRLLIDGGLFSIVPTAAVKQMGADIVIGVDIAATRYMFKKSFYRARAGYNFLRRSFFAQIYLQLHSLLEGIFTNSVNTIYYNQSDVLEEQAKNKQGMFAVLGRAIDLSRAQSENQMGFLRDCDCLISPQVKHLGKADFVNAKIMLEEGRRAAREALPEIRRAIGDFQWRASVKGRKRFRLKHV